jgi:hypothetical protein
MASRLDYEKDRRYQMPRDFAPDSPPLTGSYHDQLRYGVRHGIATEQSTRKHSNLQASGCGSKTFDFDQLRSYTRAVNAHEFEAKWPTQRKELLDNLRTLMTRCERWESFMSSADMHAVRDAKFALGKRTSPVRRVSRSPARLQ